MRRLALAGLAALASCGGGGGTLCHAADALDAPTYWASYTWTGYAQSNLAPAKAYAGGMLEAQAGFGHWGVGVRLAAAGEPGEYRTGSPTTFKALEGGLAVTLNLAALSTPDGSTVVGGLGLVVDKSLSYGTDAPVTTPQKVTAGLVVKVQVKGGFLFLLGPGVYESFTGAALIGTATIPLRGSILLIANGAIGPGGAWAYRAHFAVRL